MIRPHCGGLADPRVSVHDQCEQGCRGCPGGPAADTAGVDRSTIMKLRHVAKEGALAALSASKLGVGKSARDVELEAANAEVARLSEAVKELAVKLTLLEGKGGSGWR